MYIILYYELITTLTALKKYINELLIGFFLISTALASPWFNLTVSNHELVKTYFCGLGISTLLVLSFIFKPHSDKVNLNLNLIKLSLLALFLYGTASFLWSLNFDSTVNKWLLWLTALFSFLVGINLSSNHSNLNKLTWGLTLSAGVIAVIGILQYLFDPFSLTQSAIPGSTFANKNIASQVIVLIFPMSFFLLLSEKNQGIRVWLITLTCSFMLVYIFYATSRAAWIVIFIEIILLILYILNHRKKLPNWFTWNSNKTFASITAVVLTISLINLSSTGYTNFLTISSDNITSISESASNSSNPRYEIWQVAKRIYLDHPFIGTGLGSFSQNLANEGYATWNINNTFRAHNDIIELAVELGALGLFILFLTVFSIVHGIFYILKKNNSATNFFYYLIFVSLSGSFINMLFSFPYQMPVPNIIFGLYCGLVAKQLDKHLKPIKTFSISCSKKFKYLLILVIISLLTILFFNTYIKWIISYDKLERMNQIGKFDEINTLDMPINFSGMQQTLYGLGGTYFNKADYHRSKIIDMQFLKIWPNHLDVLFRVAYANNKLGNNDNALKLAKRLQQIEPEGLYNGYIVEMFVYLSLNEIDQLELKFNELISKPKELLSIYDDTYRFLIFFTLASKNLYKFAPILYEMFIESHGYSCEVENNLAIHYFNLEKYDLSTKHIQNTSGRDKSCLNPELLKLLNEKT